MNKDEPKREKIGNLEFWLERNLQKAGMEVSAKKYLEKSAGYSALAGIFFWFATGLITGKILAAMGYGLVIGLVCFAVFLYMPEARKKKTGALLEKDLPFALNSMAVELNLQIPFEKCMENVAKEKYGLVSNEFRKVIAEMGSAGSSMQEGLLHLTERVDSLILKRAVVQLVNVYEQGDGKKSGEPVKRLAAEILSKQRAESKEFAGKLVVFSLLFIAVSAIIPAIFQAFIIVGSMFLKLNFTAPQVLLIVAVGFPVLDLAVLFYIKSKTPVFLRE